MLYIWTHRCYNFVYISCTNGHIQIIITNYILITYIIINNLITYVINMAPIVVVVVMTAGNIGAMLTVS